MLDDSGIVRGDIRASFGSSTTTADGVPLAIRLTVRNAATGDPVQGPGCTCGTATARATTPGRSLTAVVEDALRESLRRQTAAREAVELPCSARAGVQPGVDLDDSAALLELMEQGDPRADHAAR